MKLYRYLLFITILLFSFTSNVCADACDTDDIKRLRVLASNVEITYEYNEDIKDSDGFTIYDTYKIIINNMTDELYVVETKTNTDFSSYPIKDGSITIDRMYSGKKAFRIYSKTCNKSLKTYYINLPKFNYYSTDANCDGKEELEVCQKFYDSSNLEYSEFYNIILDYENGNEVIDDNNDQNEKDYLGFIKDNYIYFIISGVILIFIIIILLVLRHRKRGVLE